MGAATGRLAQLVEHLVYTERVGGSSPSPPTSLRACARFGWQATTVSRREGRAGRSLLRSLRFGKSAAPNPSGARRSPTSFLRPSHGLRKSSPGTCNPGLTCLTPPFKRTPPSRASALCAGVAQLVRASACHAEGRGFEPRHSRHFPLLEIPPKRPAQGCGFGVHGQHGRAFVAFAGPSGIPPFSVHSSRRPICSCDRSATRIRRLFLAAQRANCAHISRRESGCWSTPMRRSRSRLGGAGPKPDGNPARKRRVPCPNDQRRTT